MKFDLKRPCPKCPFRYDVPGYLTQRRAALIIGSLERGQSFTCHETTQQTDDGERVDAAGSQHCAGALLLTIKEEALPQLARIAWRFGEFDPDALDMRAPVFDEFDQFISHHDG